MTSNQSKEDFLRSQAISLHMKGALEEAEVHYRAILEINPENSECLHLFGVLCCQKECFAEGVEWIKKAIALNPSFSEAHFNLGKAYKEIGDNNSAIKSFQNAVAINPKYYEAHNNLGIIWSETGNNSAAITSFSKAIETNPSFVEGYFNLGNSLEKVGKENEAIQHYRRAIELEPEFAEAYYNLAKTLENNNREEAIENYRLAIKIKPNFAPAFNDLAVLYKKSGKIDAAIENYKKALEINPLNYLALNNLGNAFRDQGNLKQALNTYDKALKINPKYADGFYNLGIALIDDYQQERAIEALQKATDIDPKHVDAFSNLGTIFSRMGKKEEAIAVCKNILELSPNNPTAHHMLSALEKRKPDSAPPDFVEELFDKYAARFENHLINKLEYKTPKKLREQWSSLKNPTFKSLLDLGCGTGLSGLEFYDICEKMTGIDLSSEMLAKAKDKSIYSRLEKSEIVNFLSTDKEKYDGFTAADTLIYFGNLEQVFEGVQSRSKVGAYFIFSIETSDDENFVLRLNGRFSHSDRYIQSLAKKFKFTILLNQSTTLRKEYKEDVSGRIYVLKTSETGQ